MLTDPVADMLTRIRNANQALHEKVSMPTSKLKEEIARILAAEGYIDGFEVLGTGARRTLAVTLRYGSSRKRVIEGLRRVSSPGRRVYSPAGELPRVQGGLGVAVISTSQGLLPDREARRRHLGGEVLCEVW
ncbi:MAG TPA: 30S ribosomal protein S8 [Acidimicrobiia bacterium]|uniref:Small ribosomal subunit protein uS8 n=1 Tax=uncultured actinobacterium Rifle_16ft_4_minimus_2010 TaxID=1665146 RepID=A0A0H4T5A4_9ACTN|nr:30S ribosomal protein S8 [uncultured actinobacterium Rifle_16ft_4_minimus_2010]HLE38511.1 30S ribosomal protein S8 [Acidimicrobiia bacterium]